MKVVNVNAGLKSITEYWKPIIAGELNGQHVKLAKLNGDFPMHFHENEDELFFVIKGKLIIDFGEMKSEINEGEFIIIPKGIYHKPIAEEEVQIMLFEPATTLNTGNLINEYTVESLKRLI